MLISGYYAIDSRFKTKKLLSLFLQIWFYVLVGEIIAIFFFDYESVSLIKAWLLPVIRSKYWFATGYILLYMFSPFFNKAIKYLETKCLARLVFLMLVVWCVVPSISGNIEGRLYYNRFIWFIVLYFGGALIRKNIYLITFKHSIIVFACSVIVTAIFIIIFTSINTPIPGNYWWPPNSIIQVLLSVSLFCIFAKIRITNNITINRIGSHTFGIYLFHDGVLRNILWNDIIKTMDFGHNFVLILNIISGSLAVFLVALIVDIIYQTIECPLTRPFAKLIDSFINLIRNFYYRFI